LNLIGDADERAPGAAVTAALCGQWEHDGSGQSVRTRTVFVCEEGDADVVRGRITRALGAGRLDGPEGTSRWMVVREEAGELDPAERQLAARLSVP
jgi:hypothetical protein